MSHLAKSSVFVRGRRVLRDPQVLMLRKQFLHGARREDLATQVRDRWDELRRSRYVDLVDGTGAILATSRITEFDPRHRRYNAGPDLIEDWTGWGDSALPKHIISRVVVSAGVDEYGVRYRGNGLNEFLFNHAALCAAAAKVPLFCIIKRDLSGQLLTAERMGFREVGKAVSHDVPGQLVPVYVMCLDTTDRDRVRANYQAAQPTCFDMRWEQFREQANSN